MHHTVITPSTTLHKNCQQHGLGTTKAMLMIHDPCIIVHGDEANISNTPLGGIEKEHLPSLPKKYILIISKPTKNNKVVYNEFNGEIPYLTTKRSYGDPCIWADLSG